LNKKTITTLLAILEAFWDCCLGEEEEERNRGTMTYSRGKIQDFKEVVVDWSLFREVMGEAIISDKSFLRNNIWQHSRTDKIPELPTRP